MTNSSFKSLGPFRVLVLVAAGVLAGCETPATPTIAQSAAPAWLSIVDKTLVTGDLKVKIGSDGKVTGTGIKGAWEERDGKYCRTLTEPPQAAGTECQTVVLNGDQVTFDNGEGRVSTWTVQ